MEDNNNTKLTRLFRDTGLFAISGFASKILLFLLTPLYTSVLATEEYGIADLIVTTINIAFPVLTLVITDATLRFGMSKSCNKQAVLGNSILIICASFILLLFLYPLSGMINGAIQEYWLFFILIFFLTSLHECLSNYAKAIGKTKEYAIQGIIQTIVFIFSNLVFLVWRRIGLSGYLLSIVIGHIPAILYIAVTTKIYQVHLKIELSLLKEMLIYSIPLIPATIAWFINTSIDKYMIISWYGISDSGIYGVAHKLPTILTTGITFFINAWTISSIQNHGSSDESSFTTKIYNVLSCLLVCGCFIIILFNRVISRVLFAKEYFQAWVYVPFLTISAIFSSLSGFLAGPYRAAKKSTSLLISVVIGAVVNIVLNATLLNYMGVLGAAIATAISFFVVWLVRIIMIQRIVQITPDLLVMILSFIIVTVACLIETYDLTYSTLLNSLLFLLVILINHKNIRMSLGLLSSLFSHKNNRK